MSVQLQDDLVAPFLKPKGALRILNKSLKTWQKEAFTGQNVGAHELEPSLFLTSGLARHFSKTGEGERQKSYVLEFNEETFIFEPFSTPQNRALIDVFLNSSHSGAAPIVLRAIGAHEMTIKPYGPPPHKLRFPVFKDWAMNIGHWVQLLDANLMALCAQAHQIELKQAFERSEGVKIHPTALIENSVIEAGAEVEAFASVRNSHIGEKAKVAAHSILDHCVLGSGSQTLVDSHLRRVVVGHNSTVANLGLSDSVLGDNVFVTTAVSVFGQEPGQMPEIDGKKLYRPVVGICIGDDAIVGARALFNAGVTLPAGIMVVGRPDEVAAKLDEPGLNRGKMQLGHRGEHV